MTFRERFMNHEAEFDEIFDLTDKWNFSDETCTLREFLGLNAEEKTSGSVRAMMPWNSLWNRSVRHRKTIKANQRRHFSYELKNLFY